MRSLAARRRDQDPEHHVAGPRVERVEPGEAVGDLPALGRTDPCGRLQAVDGLGEPGAAGAVLDGEEGLDPVEGGAAGRWLLSA